MSFVPGSFAPGRAWGTERKYDSVAAIRCDSYAPNPFPSNTQTIHDKFPGEDAHNEKYVNNQGGTNPANPGSTDPVPTTSVITPGPSATSQPGFGSGTSWKDNLVRYAMILGIPLIVMAVIVIADCFLSKEHQLWHWGILPRTTQGLLGILFAPWIHTSFGHLLANSTPWACLGFLLLLRSEIEFFSLVIFGAVVGGFGVWCIGADAYHVGLSGVVFSLFGYLVCAPCFEQPVKFVSLVITLVVGFLYTSLILGVLPSKDKEGHAVSWEGHLCGVLAGVLYCWLYNTYIHPHRSAYTALPNSKDVAPNI